MMYSEPIKEFKSIFSAVELEDKNPISFEPGTALKEIEKHVIMETLRHQKYNRTRTAKVLGIGIRTLQRKLKRYQEEEQDFGQPIMEDLSVS